MQPTTAQLRTAIEVLGMLGEHITKSAADAIILWGEERPGQSEAKTIEQITRIQTVAVELEQWRNELVQQRRQHVSHHI
jgi:capsule polysaccharide modification protein KpsS